MKIFKNLFIISSGCAILVLLLMWMAGVFNMRVKPGLLPEKTQNMGSYPSVKAAYRTMDQTAEAVGSIQSRSTSNISSKIMASIKTVNVHPGDKVKKGDLLITLDDRDLQARLEQARQGLQAADAAYKQAKLDKDRYEKLLKDKSVPQTAYDNMASTERIASAKLEQAREQVRETEIMLSYSKIYATMEGTVTEKLSDPGDMASPGQPILTMYDPANLRLEAAVREQLTGRLKIGQNVKVLVDAVNKEVSGTVEEIVPSSSPASRSVTVKVAIPKMEGIYPGMFGRINIPLDPVKYLLIPDKAVKRAGQLELVVIKEENKAGTRAVRTGSRINNEVEILSGLSEGDEIIVDATEG